MSGADWKELEMVWRGLPERAAPAVAELKRMRRWRWVSRVFVVGDVIMTLVGIGIGIWLIGHGDAFSITFGAATLIFTSAAAALSFWARWGKMQGAHASVQEALDLAVANALIGVKLSVASMWTVCLGLLFLAILAFGRVWGDPPDGPKVQALLLGVGVAQVWLALVLGVTIVYHGQRRTTLAKLEQLRDAFRQEV
jgi:hypothetical protein